MSSIPELEDQVARTRNALAVLIGRPPGPLPELAEREGLIPVVDRAVLEDVPADLLLPPAGHSRRRTAMSPHSRR